MCACVCACACACVLPGESAAVFVVALLPGDGGSMEAPGGPQVPGQNRQRVFVDQTTTRRHQGTVMTRRQLRRRREKKKRTWSETDGASLQMQVQAVLTHMRTDRRMKQLQSFRSKWSRMSAAGPGPGEPARPGGTGPAADTDLLLL